MVLYPTSTVFQLYHGDSSHYSCLSLVLPVLGWGFEVSRPRTLPQSVSPKDTPPPQKKKKKKKKQRIQWGSNP